MVNVFPMPKTLILSVLKPVDDVRSYHRIALHLLPKTDQIICVGFKGNTIPTQSNIRFIELFNSTKHANRLGLWRFWAGWKVFFLLWKEKPQKIIVSAVELLPFVLLFKLFFTFEWIYDVQENYAFNIRFQDNYPKILKHFLARCIYGFEKFASHWIDEFWLAESCYLIEMPYLQHKNYKIIANKFVPSIDFSFVHQPQQGDTLATFLLYGSFSTTYGTLEGIDLFKKLHRLNPHLRLQLAGYCTDKAYLSTLYRLTEDYPHIEWLFDGTKPIAHSNLLAVLRASDAVILPYLPNQSTQNCIPSKFYECIAFQKPMLVSKNTMWRNFLEPLQAALFFDLDCSDLETEKLAVQLTNTTFYEQKIEEEVWRF